MGKIKELKVEKFNGKQSVPCFGNVTFKKSYGNYAFFQASPCSLPKSTSFYKEWMDLGLSVAFKTVAVNHYAQKHSAVSNDSFTYTTLQNKLQPKVS